MSFENTDKILKLTASDLNSLVHSWDKQVLLTRKADEPHDSVLGHTVSTDTRIHDKRSAQLQPGHDDHHFLRVTRFGSSSGNATYVTVRVGDYNLERPNYVILGTENSTDIHDVVPIQGHAQYAVFGADGFRIYDDTGVELGDKVRYDFEYDKTYHQLTVVRTGDHIVLFAFKDSTTPSGADFVVKVYVTGTGSPAANGGDRVGSGVAAFPFTSVANSGDNYVSVDGDHYFTWLDGTVRKFYKHVLYSTGTTLVPSTTALTYDQTKDIQVTSLPSGSQFGSDGYIYTVDQVDVTTTRTTTIRRAAFIGHAMVYTTVGFESFRSFTETDGDADDSVAFKYTYILTAHHGRIIPTRVSTTSSTEKAYLMGPDGFDEVDSLWTVVTDHGMMKIAATGHDLEVTRWRFDAEDRAGATHVELWNGSSEPNEAPNPYVVFTNAAGTITVNGGEKDAGESAGSRYSLDNERDVLAMSPNGHFVLDRHGRVFAVPFHTEDVLNEVWNSAEKKYIDETRFNNLVEFVRTILSPLMVLDAAAGTYVDPRCMCLNPAPSAEKLYDLSEFDSMEQADILKIIECFSTECARVRTDSQKSVVQQYMLKHSSGCSTELLKDFIQPEDNTYFWVVIGILLVVIVAYIVWKMMQ